MYEIVVFIHLIVCTALIALVLLQQGKGSEMGAAFGSGASGTVFGSVGAASFLTKMVGWLAAVFFVTSLSMGYIVAGKTRPSGIDDLLQAAEQQSVTGAGEVKPALVEDNATSEPPMQPEDLE